LTSKINQKARAAKRDRKVKVRSETKRSNRQDTKTETFALYRAGKSVAEIAAERALSPMTIESHLSFFIEEGAMDVNELVTDQKLPIIKDAIESYGVERLAPLKEVLGDDYSYGEIKAVISWMKRSNTL
jgi:ATP-dependent DNA helicase RecQ